MAPASLSDRFTLDLWLNLSAADWINNECGRLRTREVHLCSQFREGLWVKEQGPGGGMEQRESESSPGPPPVST